MRREYRRFRLLLKTPCPSRKNGRRSWKNVSKPERLTTDGSASTWPKSGLTVAFIVRFDVRPYLMSAPKRDWLFIAYPPAAGALAVCATLYGENSARREETIPSIPLTSPNC